MCRYPAMLKIITSLSDLAIILILSVTYQHYLLSRTKYVLETKSNI